MRWKIPLTQPVLGVDEVAAVTRVLESGWLTQGAEVEAFEREFAESMGVKHALAVTNCTAALHLAYVALGVGPGDQVICPALTFVATANAARYTGAEVRFAGVCSEDDLTVSPAAIEAAITPRTRAITVMHYGGFLCRMEEILELARRRGLAVVEDCAHAPLSWMPGGGGIRSYAGSIGDIGCFSFFGNKNMTTGEGGMLTTNNDALATQLRLLRSHGMTSLTLDRHRGHAHGYDVVALGYNYRMDELRAALGRCQLARLPEMNEGRRAAYRWYQEELAAVPEVRIPFSARELAQSACHLMAVLAPRELASPIREQLQQNGVQTSRHYELIPNFTAYRGENPEKPLFADRELLTLPLGPRMHRDEVTAIASVVRAAVLQQREPALTGLRLSR